MASQYVRAARFQTILMLYLFATPTIALLIYALTIGADHTTFTFWIGMTGMIAGYALMVRAKWDQIQAGDFFTWGLTPAVKHLKPLYTSSYVFMLSGFVLAGVSGTL